MCIRDSLYIEHPKVNQPVTVICSRNKKEGDMPKNPNNPNENGGNKEPISFIQSGLQYIHPASFFQAADKKIPRQRKEKHIKRKHLICACCYCQDVYKRQREGGVD